MSDKLNFLASFASCGTQFILEYEMALYARVYQSIKCIKSNRILWWPGLWFYQKQDEYEKELAPNCFGKSCLYRSGAVTWLERRFRRRGSGRETSVLVSRLGQTARSCGPGLACVQHLRIQVVWPCPLLNHNHYWCGAPFLKPMWSLFVYL